jgi:hypothetical protein
MRHCRHNAKKPTKLEAASAGKNFFVVALLCSRTQWAAVVGRVVNMRAERPHVLAAVGQ